MNLVEASSVYFLTDKKCFCISLNDGGLLFLDASTLEEADEWVRCLNAVLFAKGINGGQYFTKCIFIHGDAMVTVEGKMYYMDAITMEKKYALLGC